MKTITASAVLSLAATGACWGDLGHRTVGYLAQHYFTKEAAQWVNGIIQPNDAFDISDAAVWPDKVRRRMHWTEGWHFIDSKDDPPQECNVNFSRDCQQDKGCIISAIMNQTAILQDPSYGAETIQEALKFIIHFLGDIHQPLHTEALDRGGNGIKVCFDNHCGEKENLHEVWDTEIPNKINGLKREPKKDEEKQTAQDWADKLYAGARSMGVNHADDCPGSDPQQCALDYATESNALVCSYVLKLGVDWIENNDLGGDYYDGAAPIVTEQITKAGQRLGAWINGLAAGQKRLVEQNEYL